MQESFEAAFQVAIGVWEALKPSDELAVMEGEASSGRKVRCDPRRQKRRAGDPLPKFSTNGTRIRNAAQSYIEQLAPALEAAGWKIRQQGAHENDIPALALVKATSDGMECDGGVLFGLFTELARQSVWCFRSEDATGLIRCVSLRGGTPGGMEDRPPATLLELLLIALAPSMQPETCCPAPSLMERTPNGIATVVADAFMALIDTNAVSRDTFERFLGRRHELRKLEFTPQNADRNQREKRRARASDPYSTVEYVEEVSVLELLVSSRQYVVAQRLLDQFGVYCLPPNPVESAATRRRWSRSLHIDAKHQTRKTDVYEGLTILHSVALSPPRTEEDLVHACRLLASINMLRPFDESGTLLCTASSSTKEVGGRHASKDTVHSALSPLAFAVIRNRGSMAIVHFVALLRTIGSPVYPLPAKTNQPPAEIKFCEGIGAAPWSSLRYERQLDIFDPDGDIDSEYEMCLDNTTFNEGSRRWLNVAHLARAGYPESDSSEDEDYYDEDGTEHHEVRDMSILHTESRSFVGEFIKVKCEPFLFNEQGAQREHSDYMIGFEDTLGSSCSSSTDTTYTSQSSDSSTDDDDDGSPKSPRTIEEMFYGKEPKRTTDTTTEFTTSAFAMCVTDGTFAVPLTAQALARLNSFHGMPTRLATRALIDGLVARHLDPNTVDWGDVRKPLADDSFDSDMGGGETQEYLEVVTTDRDSILTENWYSLSGKAVTAAREAVSRACNTLLSVDYWRIEAVSEEIESDPDRWDTESDSTEFERNIYFVSRTTGKRADRHPLLDTIESLVKTTRYPEDWTEIKEIKAQPKVGTNPKIKLPNYSKDGRDTLCRDFVPRFAIPSCGVPSIRNPHVHVLTPSDPRGEEFMARDWAGIDDQVRTIVQAIKLREWMAIGFGLVPLEPRVLNQDIADVILSFVAEAKSADELGLMMRVWGAMADGIKIRVVNVQQEPAWRSAPKTKKGTLVEIPPPVPTTLAESVPSFMKHAKEEATKAPRRKPKVTKRMPTPPSSCGSSTSSSDYSDSDSDASTSVTSDSLEVDP